MKKTLALLLGIAIVISSTACSAEETEQKKKKKKKQKDTETESISETDLEESESTDAPTDPPSDPSADPSDTPSNYTFVEEFSINEGSLHHINVFQSTGYHSYGVYVPDEDSYYGNVPSVDVVYDTLFFDGSSFQDLGYRLEEIFGYKSMQAQDVYDDAVDDLLSSVSAGDDPITLFLEMKATVIRADEQVVSFMYEQSPGGDYYNDEHVLETYTICPDCGEDILFTDIVTDVDGFTAFLEEYLADELNNEVIADLISKCKDGSIKFLLAYDGIMLYMENDLYPSGFVKIPAYLLEGMANMYWFGSTPEYYVLYPEIDNSYAWDFNGDLAVDTLSFECVQDDYYSLDHIDFDINGTSFQITADELIESDEDLYWIGTFKSSLVMRTDSGFFLYLTFWGEDISEDTMIFHITNDMNVEYMGYTGVYLPDYPCDPSNFIVRRLTNLGGTGMLSGSASVIGTGGKPQWMSEVLERRSHVLVTKTDLTMDEFGGGDTVTIPAGTPVAVRFYYPDSQLVMIEVLDRNGYSNVYMMDVNTDEFPPEFGGISQNDAFYGLFYAG